jgi:ABC-type Fe3+/spermidine/putrescine transport system ATPase subunit
VTHDREEAMVMADRIVILNEGRVEQEAPPEEIYNAPATPFVARFMGAENVIELKTRVTDAAIEILAGPSNESARLRRPASLKGGAQTVSAYFRSEAAELIAGTGSMTETSKGDSVLLTGRIAQASYPGGIWRHTVRLGDREVYVDAPIRHDPATEVYIRLREKALFVFPGKAEGRNGAAARTARTEAEKGTDFAEMSEARSASG